MRAITISTRSLVCAVAAALVASVAMLGLAPAAANGNYVVQQCGNGGASPGSDLSASGFGARKIYTNYECGAWRSYGGVLEANGRSDQGAWSGWYVNAAPGTSFKVARASVHYSTGDGYGPASDASNGGVEAFPGAGHQFVTAERADTTRLGVLLVCWRNGGCQSVGGAPGPHAAFAYVSNIHLEVVDLAAPSVSASGELLGGQVVRGVEQLQVSAEDVGGGVRGVSVEVNGVLSDARDICPASAQTGAYSRVRPCPSSTGAAFSLDTESDPGWVNGPNAVRICAGDAAGNGSPSCVERTVTVDNTCPASGGATAASELSSGVETRSGELSRAADLNSNTAPVVRGTLRNGAGAPIAGATICVYETVDLSDGSRQLVETASTQPNGRFAARLDPGPSRELDVVYRYNTELLEQSLDVDSTVVPTLSIPRKRLRNGQSALFRGRLPGPNAEGRAISLQAKVGRKWRTFKQLRSNSLGLYRGKYPFRQTIGKVRYTFRALVKRQGGYPYEAGSSRKRKVLVRG